MVALCDYEQQIQVVVLSQTVDRILLVDKMEKILNIKELWSRSYPWNVICTYVSCKAMYATEI